MNRPILHVEDEENEILFMRIAMEKAGLTIPLQVARDGREGIQYLSGEGCYADREKYPMPCLVVLDLRLPLVPGFAVLKWIREQPPLANLPVIVLSNSSQESDMEKAHRLGANAYFQKPANPLDLVETVKYIKTKWLRGWEQDSVTLSGNTGKSQA